MDADDEFGEQYNACRVLITEIESLVGGLTFASGGMPSAPASVRTLRRPRNPREMPDGTLEPFLLSTTANFIAEDLVQPDYRVRTS
jgi:hypothetical protein